MPDEEAADIVAELVEQSYEMNAIYFGEGMPVRDDEEAALYAYVADDAPYLTEAELREATLEVYTTNYAAYLFQMFLTGYSDSDSGVVYARYVENGDRLMKRLDIVSELPPRTYDLDSIEIVRSRKKEIKAIITSTDGVEVSVTVRLEERASEDGGVSVWRLDSPTY